MLHSNLIETRQASRSQTIMLKLYYRPAHVYSLPSKLGVLLHMRKEIANIVEPYANPDR